MNKKYIIRKNEAIQEIIKTGIKNISKFFIIYIKDNNLSYNRYCISVSKKIGNAVIRNKLKRQFKDIISKKIITSSKDYVIILRKEVLTLSFKQKEESLINTLKEIK